MWFQMDDTFDTSEQVMHAGTAAFGLYARCGLWSARERRDGYVSSAIADLYGTREWSERLVGAGLWLPAPGGFVMPDFLDRHRNLSADTLAARKAAAAERQARARERKRVTRDVTRDSPVSHGVSHAVTHASPSPSPPTGDGGARTRATPTPPTCEIHALPLPCRGCRADALAGDT